jgi:hypothetical protein
VVALTVLGYAGVVFSARKPAAKLLPAMMLPALALGMNHPAPDGFVVAGVMLAGCAWATGAGAAMGWSCAVRGYNTWSCTRL